MSYKVVNFNEEVLGTFSEFAKAERLVIFNEDKTSLQMMINTTTRDVLVTNKNGFVEYSAEAEELMMRAPRRTRKSKRDRQPQAPATAPKATQSQPAPKSINQLKAEINRLQAEVDCREAGMKDQNSLLLMEEVRNLRQKVGEGFMSGDYYAPERYYSKIEGVKNIRRASFDGEPHILVKVTSPKGELLPKEVTVEGTTYKVVYIESLKYKGKIDY